MSNPYEEYVLAQVKYHLDQAAGHRDNAADISDQLTEANETYEWPQRLVDERIANLSAANYHATMAQVFAIQIGQWYEYDGEWAAPQWLIDQWKAEPDDGQD